jgi:hydroxyacylglutathione hydrolase
MKTWKTSSGLNIIQILSGRSNVFLLTNGTKNILIDTSPKYMWKLLQKRLINLNVNNIDYLILTHTHMDHAENSYYIKEKYNSLVIVHRDEASFLTSGNNIIPDGTNYFTRKLMKYLPKYLAPLIKYKPCQYDILVDTKYDLNDFGFNAYIIHTPGHTLGSMSIIIDDEVAIVGDSMFGVYKGSVFPPFANDINQMINSWGILLKTNCSVFLPGHGTANDRSLVQKDYNIRVRQHFTR